MQKVSSYIPCHIIANLLAEMFTLPVTLASSAVLCGHIMSGCDTISCVFGKGKKKSFKVAIANASDLTCHITLFDFVWKQYCRTKIKIFQDSAITEKLGVCFRLIQFRQDNDLLCQLYCVVTFEDSTGLPWEYKNSSGDEIANVNFLRRYGTYVLQNTKKENLLRLTN